MVYFIFIFLFLFYFRENIVSANNKVCILCKVRKTNVAFRPCNHTIACFECAKDIYKCPKSSCGFAITDKI